MTLTLYNITADHKALDKLSTATTITQTALTLSPTEKIDILNPVFYVDYDPTYIGANYCYCDLFARYYYIRGAAATAKRFELRCAVDVRQTYAAGIQAASGVVIRAESFQAPTMYPDSKLPVYPSRKIITSILLPETSGSFNTDAPASYLLTVIGGEPSL